MNQELKKELSTVLSGTIVVFIGGTLWVGIWYGYVFATVFAGASMAFMKWRR